MLDEIVRRATGATIAAQVRDLIAGPLGLDMWIGVPEEVLPRVVPGRWDDADPIAPGDEPPAPSDSYAALRHQFLQQNPPMDPNWSDPADVRAHYTTERPGVGAVTDARGLARMYAALLTPVRDVQLITEATRQMVTRPRTDHVDTLIESGTAGPDIRFGLGYQLASPSMPGLGPRSFGHTGAGGRLGIADPNLDIGVGYLCSRMRNIGPTGDPRWHTRLNAIARCVSGTPASKSHT